MTKIFAGVVLVALLLLAIDSKVMINKVRQKDLVETISTPVSQAITQLIGMAGGIYLSLIMLTSFLSIEVADTITYNNFTFDPLASFSIIITLIQPIIQKYFRN